MSDESRPGYYKDQFGVWQKDRRRNTDRRGGHGHQSLSHHDRRTMKRRKSDHDILERETKLQIEEAMEEFAAEHEGQA